MSSSSKKEGCKFCTRYGFPILPVRPAIMSQNDILPVIPNTIDVPINNQGETAYTLRLLRAGYLNIWDELGQSWINYYVTKDGFYYPLPENGEAPDDILSGEVTPCINKPEELARASFITLPIFPAPLKNGNFWFSWSEVKWTDSVRKKHEEPSFYQDNMQLFNLEKWLETNKEKQSLPLNKPDEYISEYFLKSRESQLRQWSPSFLFTASILTNAIYGAVALHKNYLASPKASGKEIEKTVSNNSHSNGAILVLQDPVGILKDLSALIQYELDRDVYKKKDIERETMLYTTISSLKEGIKNKFQSDYITKTIQNNDLSESVDVVRVDANGIVHKYPEGDATYKVPIDAPDSDIIKQLLAKSVIEQKTQAHWAKYEKYYDTEKFDTFEEEFKNRLSEYTQKTLNPRIQLYLDWFESQKLTDYFLYNFDENDITSGMEYTATVCYAVANMANKERVRDFFSKALLKDLTDKSNIVARALAFNHETLIQKINKAVFQSPNLTSVPWNGLIDAMQQTVDKVNNPGFNADSVMGLYLANFSAAIIKSTNTILESEKVFPFLVTLGVIQKKAIIPLSKSGEYKHFIKYVVSELMTINNGGVTPNQDLLELHVRAEIKRKQCLGLDIYNIKTQKYLIDIDITEWENIKNLPKKAKEEAMAGMLFTTSESKEKLHIQWKTQLTTGSGKALTLMGAGVLSGILQTVAVLSSADFGNKKTLTKDQLEENSRFYAGAAAVLGTGFGVIETGIQEYVRVHRMLTARTFNGLKSLETVSKVMGRFFGLAAGIVTVAFDIYHMIEENVKGNTGLFIAYATSAAAGIWFIFLIFASSLTPFGLVITLVAVILMLGTAIYIAIEGQDNIQKWLEQCLWQKIPNDNPEYKLPPIYPTMEMEMYEFKQALGQD